MNINKKVKHHLLNTSIFFSSFGFVVPNIGVCTLFNKHTAFQSYPSSFNIITLNLLDQAQRRNLQELHFEFQRIAEMIAKSDDPLTDSCDFLQDLITKTNHQLGTSLTLSEILLQTRNILFQLEIPEHEIEKCMVGLDLLDLHYLALNEMNFKEYIRLAGHHKNKGLWTWLTVATVSAAAVTICVLLPELAPAVISGAVEIGKAAVSKE